MFTNQSIKTNKRKKVSSDTTRSASRDTIGKKGRIAEGRRVCRRLGYWHPMFDETIHQNKVIFGTVICSTSFHYWSVHWDDGLNWDHGKELAPPSYHSRTLTFVTNQAHESAHGVQDRSTVLELISSNKEDSSEERKERNKLASSGTDDNSDSTTLLSNQEEYVDTVATTPEDEPKEEPTQLSSQLDIQQPSFHHLVSPSPALKTSKEHFRKELYKKGSSIAYVINEEDFRPGMGATNIKMSNDHLHLRYIYNNTQEEDPEDQSDSDSIAAQGPTKDEMEKSTNSDIPNDHDFSDIADYRKLIAKDINSSKLQMWKDKVLKICGDTVEVKYKKSKKIIWTIDDFCGAQNTHAEDLQLQDIVDYQFVSDTTKINPIKDFFEMFPPGQMEVCVARFNAAVLESTLCQKNMIQQSKNFGVQKIKITSSHLGYVSFRFLLDCYWPQRFVQKLESTYGAKRKEFIPSTLQLILVWTYRTPGSTRYVHFLPHFFRQKF